MGEICKQRQLNEKKWYGAVQNLVHFRLEQRISNQNRTVHEQNGENQTRTE
jgi:hypothetical protein